MSSIKKPSKSLAKFLIVWFLVNLNFELRIHGCHLFSTRHHWIRQNVVHLCCRCYPEQPLVSPIATPTSIGANISKTNCGTNTDTNPACYLCHSNALSWTLLWPCLFPLAINLLEREKQTLCRLRFSWTSHTCVPKNQFTNSLYKISKENMLFMIWS